MAKMTSAYANKMLKKLSEDKDFWTTKEMNSSFYTAAVDEEPVIPEYDYAQVAAMIDEIDEKIVKIKHAVNLTNATSEIAVGNQVMSVDMILVKMAQHNRRKRILDAMRKTRAKGKSQFGMYHVGKSTPEYRYINYDLELIKREYERIDTEIAEMQIALDKYNQTFEFEVEL